MPHLPSLRKQQSPLQPHTHTMRAKVLVVLAGGKMGSVAPNQHRCETQRIVSALTFSIKLTNIQLLQTCSIIRVIRLHSKNAPTGRNFMLSQLSHKQTTPLLHLLLLLCKIPSRDCQMRVAWFYELSTYSSYSSLQYRTCQHTNTTFIYTIYNTHTCSQRSAFIYQNSSQGLG